MIKLSGVKYENGEMSCNCPVWIYRKKCRHVEAEKARLDYEEGVKIEEANANEAEKKFEKRG